MHLRSVWNVALVALVMLVGGLAGCGEGKHCIYARSEGESCVATCECARGLRCAPDPDPEYGTPYSYSYDGEGGIDCATRVGICQPELPATDGAPGTAP